MKFRKLESLEGGLDIKPKYHKEDDVYGITLDIKLDYRRKLDDRYKLDNDTEYMNYLSNASDLMNDVEEGLKEGLREICEETINRLDKVLYHNIDNIKTTGDE